MREQNKNNYLAYNLTVSGALDGELRDHKAEDRLGQSLVSFREYLRTPLFLYSIYRLDWRTTKTDAAF